MTADHDYWQRLGIKRYRRMQQSHKKVWRWIKQYVREHEIQSILEAGCGAVPKARKWVPKYTGIDLVEREGIIQGDFLTMDMRQWRGVDLFLAVGMVEHLENGYESLLRQIDVLQPRHALIPFFGSLGWTHDSSRLDSRGVWGQVYNRATLEGWLTAIIGCSFSIEEVTHRDMVLVIKGEGH